MPQEQNIDESQLQFIKSNFSTYYRGFSEFPTDITMREFGFGNSKKIDFRHKAFRTPQELQEYLVANAPLYASYSIATYKQPSARPMEKKDRVSCDLVFDIDASPQGHDHNPLLCMHCLENSKTQATSLLEEFLLTDFGFKPSEVKINFSGSKGYHLHIQTPAVRELSQKDRMQITDYISGQGLQSMQESPQIFRIRRETKQAAITDVKREVYDGPSPLAKGWHKKIFQAMQTQLLLPKEELEKSLREMGLTAKEARLAADNKQQIMEKMKTPLSDDAAYSKWEWLPSLKELSIKIIKKQNIALSVQTDKTVTYDLSRLIRMPGSLHGDTALCAKKISSLSAFEPSKDAVAFDEKQNTDIIPSITGTVTLLGREFEFQEGKTLNAPLPLALLFLCRNKAKLAPTHQ